MLYAIHSAAIAVARCDPILTDWDAELVETEGAAVKTSEEATHE
jgi:hypothetical protein